MARTLVVGDIHGALLAFEQCLERCGYTEEDTIISLGDLADGWPDVAKLIERIRNIKNKIVLLGNHDQWLLEWLKSGGIKNGNEDTVWLSNGGTASIESYNGLMHLVADHIKFLEEANICFVDEKNRLFVHAGINTDLPLEKQKLEFCLWNRGFVNLAFKRKTQKNEHNLTEYQEVYIGHTPVMNFPKGDDFLPQKACEVWNLDTGAGFWGKLTIMDIDTKEFWQSDEVPKLYPNNLGRWQ